MATTPTPPLGVRSSLTATGPSARTTMGSNPAPESVEPVTTALAEGARVPDANKCRCPDATAYALKVSGVPPTLRTANASRAAPLTAGLAGVPGGATIHSLAGVELVRLSTAVATPA
jgi:hypothetical protein